MNFDTSVFELLCGSLRSLAYWQKISLAILLVLGDGERVESILPARTSGAQHALVTSPSICELLPWLTWMRELAASSTETFKCQ